MLFRHWRKSLAVALPLLLLGACSATPPPVTEPVAEAPPPRPAKPPVKTARARPKRPDAPCRTTDLTASRKQELFRQFAATQDASDLASPETAPAQPGCRQAAR